MAEGPDSTKARRFELLKEKLKAANTNIPETISNIKEFLDKFPGSSPDQPNYYGTITPDLLDQLKAIPCRFTNCAENTARMNILEIILKCPNFDILRNYYIHLFKAVEEVITNDNEDNASVALKLFIDLTKAYKEMVIENTIQKFIKFADGMFKKSEEIARLAIERGLRNDLVPSQESFKVLIECGSVITSLWHHFQRLVPIKDFITLAFDIVTRDEPKDITRYSKVYNDYIQCKTKTFSFLAQFAQSEQINRDLRVPADKLPGVLLKMMRNIPSDMYNIKKDIFQGFSLIIKSSAHKPSFSKHIDSFLEENDINGNSSSIRASWYACMLEFIDTFKTDMTHEQLSKAVALVCKNIHHFTPNYQGQSFNTLKSLLESIKNLRDRGQRTTLTPAIDTMYFMILATLSKRLSCFKVIIEDMTAQAREMRNSNQRPNINLSEPMGQYKKVAEIVKMVITEKHHSNSQFITSPWDQPSVKIVTKIIKNMVMVARVYTECKYEREETGFYEIISLIFYNITSNQGSMHIFNDIFQTILPFLFLMSAENSNLNKLFENLARNFRENIKVLGDTIMPFIIDNLELIEQDSSIAETKIMALHIKAKLPLPGIDKKEYRKRLGKRLSELFEMMLVPEILEIHGKRLIQKCEELCRDEIIPRYVVIAKSCVKKVFSNRNVRMELSTPWLQQQDPLLLPNPPYHLICSSLCSSAADKVSQACILLEENSSNINLTQEIIKRLFDLMKSQKDIPRIIAKLGNNIRNSRHPVSVKAWSAPPNIITDQSAFAYAFTFDLIYDPLLPPIKIPMDYVISKINNSLKAKTAVDENQKKTVQAASKIVSICILNLLSKLKIDTKLVASKVASIVLGRKDDYFPPNPLIPEIHRQSFSQTLKSALEVLISLISIPDTVEDLSELYETVFIHMGFLMFSSLEGTFTDIGFNTLEILDILCGKLTYLEKDNDKRFKASLKGLNNIITTVSKILGRIDNNLYKSETIKQILLALIRTCYQPDWTTQFGACGGLYRLLRGFPAQTIRDFSMQLLKTSLHVLQSFNSVCKTQLSEEIIQLFNAVYDNCDKSKVLFELVQGLLSQSPNLRYISRKLIHDHDLVPEMSKTFIPIFDKMSVKSISDQVKDLIFSQNYKSINVSTRAMLLETLNFAIKKRIITFATSKAEIVQFLMCVEESFKEEQKEQKRQLDESPEKYNTEKIAAFECMKALLEEEEFWTCIRDNDREAQDLRYKITSRFLRAVGYHTDQHIITIVKSGIEILLKKESNSRHILPQIDLKDCLRPILTDLAKTHNLPSLQLITNFSRLLEVISDCFNVNLGSRLINHINRIEPQNKELLPLIPAIANLFYLMPKCTEEILTNVIQGFSKAEENLQKNQLQGYLSSFFTVPLIRYITRFPDKTLKYFFEDRRNLKYFTNLINHPVGYPLRDIIAREYSKYIEPHLAISDSKDYIDAIKITNALVKFMPRWISTRPNIISKLKTIYNETDSTTTESEIIERSYMHKYIIKAFISFIRYNHNRGISEILLDLPVAYGRKNIWNLDFLTRFLKKELVSILSTQEKRKVLKFIMKFLHEPTQTNTQASLALNDKKNKVLEYLLIPFIGECFKDSKKSQIITKSIHISTIRLIRKHLTDYLNTCCVHLMNLGSMLIENFETEFFHYRKELIKFYWGMIKSDNPFIKGSAYVNVARFIGVYNLPDSLTVQLLGALFKAHHIELSGSAHQAFACLSEKLIQFFREARFRDYLTEYVKKYLYQETRQFQSMLHVIDIIIKNSNVFYHIRDGLISHFLNWINHLGLGLHSNYNAKKTLLELTAVMIKFSEQHSKENNDSYITTSHKEMLINFFARFGQAPALYISRNPQRSFEQMNILSVKCIENMKSALKLWGEVNFKARNWTEALKKCVNLVQQHQQRNNAADALKKLLERSLSIIKILSEHNTRTAILQYPELIKYLALQVKSTDSPMLTKSLCETVSILLAHPAEDLRKQLNEILENTFTGDNSQSCYWTIQLLTHVIRAFPDDVVQHMKGLLNLTSNLIKEINQDASLRENKLETIQLALGILQSSIIHLTDENRRGLKHILATIFENHSEFKSIVTAACKVMENWLCEYDRDTCFNVKEQCSVLMKLFTGFKLEIKYSNLPLELAARILSSTSDCYEPRIQLCKAILQYLLMDPGNEFKPQFNQILKDLIGVSIWRRLLFVFDQFDGTDPKFWVRLALDILLGGLEDSAVVDCEDMEEDIETQLDRNTAELLRQHFKYIKNNRIRQAKDLITSLRHVTNFQISSSLFIHIFPQIWSILSNSQQNSLVFTMESMFIHKQPTEPSDSNSFKSILTAVSCCSPLPSIRPEILQYLAKVYNCWHISIPLLETYSVYLPDKEKPLMYLEQLSSRLGERELSIGYKLIRSKSASVKAALKLSLLNRWADAREEYEKIMSTDVEDADIARESWDEAAERMADWKILLQYGDRQDLSSVDWYWQEKKYQEYQSLVKKLNISNHPTCIYYKSVEALESRSCDDLTYIKEIENELESSAKEINYEWTAIPKHPSPAHLPLVQLLDLRNEVYEGISLLRILDDSLRNTRYSDKSDIIERWKNKAVRLQDGLRFWGMAFRVRKSILKSCSKIIEKGPNTLSIQFDPNSEIVAIELSYINLLRKVAAFPEAFETLKNVTVRDRGNDQNLKSIEEVKLSLAYKDLEGALSLANFYCHNEAFSKELIAEFRRLKGKIYKKMGNDAMAIRCFKNSYQGNPKVTHALLSLGKVLAALVPEPKSTEANEILTCFLLGIQHRIAKHKSYIPRIINLLEACDNFDKWNEYSEKIFVYCVPFLFQILKKIEKSRTTKPFELFLKYTIEYHPQALFFNLRNFVERRSVSMDKVLPFVFQKTFADLKKVQGILVQTLENLCENLTTYFRPTLDEELFSVFSLLLAAPLEYPLEDYKEVFEQIKTNFLRKENEDFCEKYSKDFYDTFNELNMKSVESVKALMKVWKDRLLAEIKQYETRFIDQDCPELSNFYSKEIELPLVSESPVIMERIHLKIGTLRSMNCKKVITFKGSNNKDYDFLIEYLGDNNLLNISQILSSLHHYIQSNYCKMTHRILGSNFELQAIQPLGFHYFLIEMKKRTISLNEIFELTVNEEMQDPDRLIMTGTPVPNYLFSSYIQRLLQSPNRFAVFKRQFSAQWALMYVFCALFNVALSDIQLNKIWVSVKSGVISFGLLDVNLLDQDYGEFRLTPNILEVIGQAALAAVIPDIVVNVFRVLKKQLPQLHALVKLVLDDKVVDLEKMKENVENNSQYDYVFTKLEEAKEASTDSNGWIPSF